MKKNLEWTKCDYQILNVTVLLIYGKCLGIVRNNVWQILLGYRKIIKGKNNLEHVYQDMYFG